MTRRRTLLACVGWIVSGLAMAAGAQDLERGWISLFDGKSLDGWKTAEESPGTFSIRDGAIVARGPRCHLFYVGPVEKADFRDFELKVDVKTERGSNGGVYFHTRWQKDNWPDKGFEVQVNNSFRSDARKTASLYRMKDIEEQLAKDDQWFTLHVTVWGKHVNVSIDGKEVLDWVEPVPANPPSDMRGRVLDRGTFALQGHDPRSTVHYRNIRVKPLPILTDCHVHLKGGLTLDEAIRMAEQRRMKFGIAENCGVGFPTTNDAALDPFLAKLDGKPVHRAMQAEGREWVTMFSPATIAKFDYAFTDSMTWTNDQGKRMRLWIPSEVEIGDKQAFMDILVERTVGILTREPIDIHVNPTFLPDVIAAEYDTLWTEERMDRVIQAAVKNGVAIEINSRYKLPGERFIQKAKEAGAKFAFGTNNGDKDLGDLAYSRRMARKYNLTREDFFVPKPDGQKPVQVKGLPR
ncbi:MAG TPA: family 16 glycoside hydrolase [Sedimentisphaerales bacterium]|nr:family 16 glycoside hydrolase [Sedimentisphaerales bacterium]